MSLLQKFLNIALKQIAVTLKIGLFFPRDHLSLCLGADYRALIARSLQATQGKSQNAAKKVPRVAFSDMMTNGFYFLPDPSQIKTISSGCQYDGSSGGEVGAAALLAAQLRVFIRIRDL